MDHIVEVYRPADEVEAQLLQQLLTEHGIETRVVGDRLFSAIGGSPPGWNVWPGIWVRSDQAEAAAACLREWEQSRQSPKPALDPRGWTCPKCSTEVESGFDVCWNCLYNPAAC